MSQADPSQPASGTHFKPEDFAPGDSRALRAPLDQLRFDRVTGSDDPNFDVAYEMMREAFAPFQGVRPREVFVNRLNWDPTEIREGRSHSYEMVLVTRSGEPVALRDHATTLYHGDTPEAVVQLLHVLVAPSLRRKGLASWLRCYPVQAARCAAAEVGLPTALPITLTTGMEHPAAEDDQRMLALKAYEAGGFLKVDPARVDYLQPDPRPRAEVKRNGGLRPRHLALLLRLLDNPNTGVISGRQLRRIVDAIYSMYERVIRPGDIEQLRASLDQYPPDDAEIDLLPPTDPKERGRAG